MAKFCYNCGKKLEDNDAFCPNCGTSVSSTVKSNTSTNESYASTSYTRDTNITEQKSKIAAGLLGIFLGSWGIHNFYLGYTSKGILQIVLSILTCGVAGIWGFIEGILILAGSISVDANGIPLKD